MSTPESETKTRILAAALDLLERNRGKNVRLEDVAKAAQVSRQAVYLHFRSRAGLMVATVQFGDEQLGARKQTEAWRKAEGIDKLDTWVQFWGEYIPQIYGVAKALMMARDTDEAVAAAWADRMQDVRKSCRKTIESLAACGSLTSELSVPVASELLFALLSISGWEQLTIDCGWSEKKYTKQMRIAARRLLVQSDPRHDPTTEH